MKNNDDVQQKSNDIYDRIDQERAKILKGHNNEILDSVILDNDIDLDKEKSREQLGFKDNYGSIEKKSMSDRMAAAQEEACRRAADKANSQPAVKKGDEMSCYE